SSRLDPHKRFLSAMSFGSLHSSSTVTCGAGGRTWERPPRMGRAQAVVRDVMTTRQTDARAQQDVISAVDLTSIVVATRLTRCRSRGSRRDPAGENGARSGDTRVRPAASAPSPAGLPG